MRFLSPWFSIFKVISVDERGKDNEGAVVGGAAEGGGAFVSVTYCTCPVSVKMYGWPAGERYTG